MISEVGLDVINDSKGESSFKIFKQKYESLYSEGKDDRNNIIFLIELSNDKIFTSCSGEPNQPNKHLHRASANIRL